LFRFYTLKDFDPITRFRLQNAFAVGIGLSLLAPVLVALKGTLLTVQIIAFLGIITTLAIYTNAYFSKFRLDTLYKLGIGVHVVLVLAAALYFWSPLGMVLLESFVGILEATIFSAYAIVLNEYIADHYPKSMKKFQITRNSMWATAGLIGLSVSMLLGHFGIPVAIGVFVVYNTIFSLYMIYNWNFYLNPEFKGYKIKEIT